MNADLATRSGCASTAPALEVTPYNVGRWCLSEDECIAQGIDFAAYERGVADAAAAFARNAMPQGWKAAPIEPTATMLCAVGSYSKDQLAAGETYRLMIAAVPGAQP
jgi:hypothetical protein